MSPSELPASSVPIAARNAKQTRAAAARDRRVAKSLAAYNAAIAKAQAVKAVCS